MLWKPAISFHKAWSCPVVSSRNQYKSEHEHENNKFRVILQAVTDNNSKANIIAWKLHQWNNFVGVNGDINHAPFLLAHVFQQFYIMQIYTLTIKNKVTFYYVNLLL